MRNEPVRSYVSADHRPRSSSLIGGHEIKHYVSDGMAHQIHSRQWKFLHCKPVSHVSSQNERTISSVANTHLQMPTGQVNEPHPSLTRFGRVQCLRDTSIRHSFYKNKAPGIVNHGAGAIIRNPPESLGANVPQMAHQTCRRKIEHLFPIGIDGRLAKVYLLSNREVVSIFLENSGYDDRSVSQIQLHF